jgi:hypothetical protein
MMFLLPTLVKLLSRNCKTPLIPIRKNQVVRHVDEIALIGMSSNWGAGHLFSTGDVL